MPVLQTERIGFKGATGATGPTGATGATGPSGVAGAIIPDMIVDSVTFADQGSAAYSEGNSYYFPRGTAVNIGLAIAYRETEGATGNTHIAPTGVFIQGTSPDATFPAGVVTEYSHEGGAVYLWDEMFENGTPDPAERAVGTAASTDPDPVLEMDIRPYLDVEATPISVAKRYLAAATEIDIVWTSYIYILSDSATALTSGNDVWEGGPIGNSQRYLHHTTEFPATSFTTSGDNILGDYFYVLVPNREPYSVSGLNGVENGALTSVATMVGGGNTTEIAGDTFKVYRTTQRQSNRTYGSVSLG